MKFVIACLVTSSLCFFFLIVVDNFNFKEFKESSIQLDKSIYKAGYLDGIKAYQDSLKFDKTRFSNDSTELFKYLK